jgi:UDP-N-acetylglucosamine--N-acetylmuramyl-(pentapeptide) pyrophosphoryl-undecaprenol N-acetylglucosamine transferase
MDLVYLAADVVVSRAGAMTVAELAASGVPAILVPLPGAPGDHQTANARVLADVGAARLLPDGSCTAATLGSLVEELLDAPDELALMGSRALRMGRKDAAAAGARVVEANAQGDREAHR